MSVKIEVISDHALEIGEGPHWDARTQALYFVGIMESTIHKYTAAGHTKTNLDSAPSFIIPVEGHLNQFVVGMGRDIVVLQWDGSEGTPAKVLRTLGSVDVDVEVQTRINDGKADPRGRLYTANMTHIYNYPGTEVTEALDGMTIDTDGNLWVAVFGTSCVYQISPRGELLLRTVQLPAKQVTSCTFGGPDLDILFVTSGYLGMPEKLKPPNGFTFKVTGLGVRGHPNFNVKL